MERERIEEYVRRCQQLVESSPQMDEENTKVKLVQPFLELLGWDLRSTEVTLEYSIQMASTSTHVDYALLVGDAPVVFVEAKPLRSDLADGDVQQLRSYMRQELDVEWGILTNGQRFEVLTENRDQNGVEELSVAQFDLEDLPENPDIVEFLTMESIRSGKSDEIAEQVAETTRSIRRLRENEERVTEAVSEAVEGEVGELTIDLEEQSLEFVQNLVTVLRDQRNFVSDAPRTDSEEPVRASQQSNDLSSADGNDARGERQGYVVRFSDGGVIPEDPAETHRQQKENMGAAVDYLVEEHDLIDRIEIPHAPPRARKNCSISDRPQHPNGEDMRGAYELSKDYFLFTALGTRAKVNRLRDLAQQVGLSVEFLGEWQPEDSRGSQKTSR